jgi:prolyl-tRNA synthetase
LEISLGRRIVDHELRGVPVRLEVGPRELAAGEATVARRATDSKETLPLPGLAGRLPRMLDDDQHELLAQATALRNRKTEAVQTLHGAQEAATRGFARIPWRALGLGGEDRLARMGISVRCLIREDGRPVDDPDEDRVEALLARAY